MKFYSTTMIHVVVAISGVLFSLPPDGVKRHPNYSAYLAKILPQKEKEKKNSPNDSQPVHCNVITASSEWGNFCHQYARRGRSDRGMTFQEGFPVSIFAGMDIFLRVVDLIWFWSTLYPLSDDDEQQHVNGEYQARWDRVPLLRVTDLSLHILNDINECIRHSYCHPQLQLQPLHPASSTLVSSPLQPPL